MVDLSNKLEGHVILWAKGHYKGRTLQEVLAAFTMYDGAYFTKDLLKVLMRTLMLTEQATPFLMEQFMDSYCFQAAHEADRLTSYQVGLADKVSINTLLTTLSGMLNAYIKVCDHVTPEGPSHIPSEEKYITIPLLLLPIPMGASLFSQT